MGEVLTSTHMRGKQIGRTLGSSSMVKGIFLLKEGIPETLIAVDTSQPVQKKKKRNILRRAFFLVKATFSVCSQL